MVLDLLAELSDGLSSKAILERVRQRRADAIATIRLLEAANQIRRNRHGR